MLIEFESWNNVFVLKEEFKLEAITMDFEGRLKLTIRVDGIEIPGELDVPPNAKGLVLFSHGSGSSRFSPRNNFVAQQLQHEGLATYLFDLLTAQEDRIYANRFNISLLVDRLVAVTRSLVKYDEIKHLPVGYFGASTGAASAIIASVALQKRIKAIVSRGGRPDLAEEKLSFVKTPILLIVGGNDTEVLAMNRDAMEKIPGIKKLEIVSGASHLFEEPGALESVAALSAGWFLKYLTGVNHSHATENVTG